MAGVDLVEFFGLGLGELRVTLEERSWEAYLPPLPVLMKRIMVWRRRGEERVWRVPAEASCYI